MMKGKTYKPFGGGQSKSLIQRAAKKAAGRAESYSFKSRNGDPGDIGLMISSEMRSLADDRSTLLDPTASLDRWTDRGSLLAAPVQASDMYLMCDKGSESLTFNGQQFIKDYSKESYDPVSGIPIPPEVTRFPYSDEAHGASKKLAAKLAKNLARRHYAAVVLQRSYRAMKSMKRFRQEVQEAHMACRKLQWVWRKRLWHTRERRAVYNKESAAATIIQCMARCFLARRNVRRKKSRRLQNAIITVSRFFIYCRRELKRRRGRNVRIKLHAVRAQAYFRARLARRRIRRMRWSVQRIRQCFKNWWHRKKGVFAKRLFHYLRRCIVARKAGRIQRIVRGYLGRRYWIRQRLSLAADNRQRQTLENALIEKELIRDVRDSNYSWLMSPPLGYGNELPRDSATEIMRCLDVSTRCVLIPSKDKKGQPLMRFMQSVDSKNSLDDLSGGSRRLISLAVLTAFCNHPSGMIDYHALEVCKQYLTPFRSGGLLDRSNDNEDAWKSLQEIPLVNIIDASELLEPTLTLRMKVTVQGHLPDKLLAEAVIVRRWTHHVDYLVKRAIWRTREKYPAKYPCPDCLESHSSPVTLRAHLPCLRYGLPSWINRSYYNIQHASLMNRLRGIIAYPQIVRKTVHEDRQTVAVKVNSRRELAKKRFAWFLDLEERIAHVRTHANKISDLDITRKSDKRALRLAKEKAQMVTVKEMTPQKGMSSSKLGATSPSSKTSQPVSPSQLPPSSTKVKSSPMFVPPPDGVDYIPFFEEYFPCAQDQISVFTEDDWIRVPGEPLAKKPSTRDKDNKVINFEIQPSKKEKKELKKTAKVETKGKGKTK
jgi:hypothetical protein